jgi:hypothetical protein
MSLLIISINYNILEKYLRLFAGIVFRYNLQNFDARKKLVEQSQKSLFAIYKKIRNQNISIDVQLKLFDSLVEPILYGSEVWGYENLEILERVHMQFCKRILNLRLSTPNFMVYGEFQIIRASSGYKI